MRSHGRSIGEIKAKLSTATRSSGSNIRGIPASGSLLARVELVRATEEDLRWQVPAKFFAVGALGGDGLKWEFIPPGRHDARGTRNLARI